MQSEAIRQIQPIGQLPEISKEARQMVNVQAGDLQCTKQFQQSLELSELVKIPGIRGQTQLHTVARLAQQPSDLCLAS